MAATAARVIDPITQAQFRARTYCSYTRRSSPDWPL